MWTLPPDGSYSYSKSYNHITQFFVTPNRFQILTKQRYLFIVIRKRFQNGYSRLATELHSLQSRIRHLLMNIASDRGSACRNLKWPAVTKDKPREYCTGSRLCLVQKMAGHDKRLTSWILHRVEVLRDQIQDGGPWLKRIVQFLSEIVLVKTSNKTHAMRSYDYEITRMVSDQIALHSVQLPLLM